MPFSPHHAAVDESLLHVCILCFCKSGESTVKLNNVLDVTFVLFVMIKFRVRIKFKGELIYLELKDQL